MLVVPGLTLVAARLVGQLPFAEDWLRHLLTVEIPKTFLYPKKNFTSLATDAVYSLSPSAIGARY
eukprot:405563-Prorocentrum_minimum.AAC.1